MAQDEKKHVRRLSVTEIAWMWSLGSFGIVSGLLYLFADRLDRLGHRDAQWSVMLWPFALTTILICLASAVISPVLLIVAFRRHDAPFMLFPG